MNHLTIASEISNKEYAKRQQFLINNGAGITLNGLPAHISGLKLKFPYVCNGTVSYPWAWDTIVHIINNKKGIFKG
jgi:hypothetical protein